MESNEYGVILFSLGISLKPGDIPERQALAFLEAFRRLPQGVIARIQFPGKQNCRRLMYKYNEILFHPGGRAKAK